MPLGIDIAEAVGEGLAGWLVESLAEFTVGFVRDNVPLGKKRHIMRDRVYKLVRTNDRKVQDALQVMSSRHAELNLAVSLINEGIALGQGPVCAGYLDIGIGCGDFENENTGPESLALGSESLEKLNRALEVCRQVQMETSDAKTKIEALRIRLFLTYVIYVSQSQYPVSTVIKLLTNCIKEAIDLTSDEASGLPGTLSVLNRRHFTKRLLGITKQEEYIVKEMQKVVLTTLSQISWYVKKQKYQLSDDDVTAIRNGFIEPCGYSDDEVKKSWLVYIVRWNNQIKFDHHEKYLMNFGIRLTDILYSALEDSFPNTTKNKYSLDPVTCGIYPDAKYDHNFHIYLMVMARPDVLKDNRYLIVIKLERIPVYPDTLGVRWIFVDSWTHPDPFGGFYDVDQSMYCIITEQNAIHLRHRLGRVYSTVTGLPLEGMHFVRNCSNKLFAVAHDELGKDAVFSKVPGDDWKRGASFDMGPTNKLFLMRQISERPKLCKVAADGSLRCSEVRFSEENELDAPLDGSTNVDGMILVDNITDITCFSRFHNSIVSCTDDFNEIKIRCLSEGQSPEPQTIGCEPSHRSAVAIMPAGYEVVVLTKEPLELVFVDIQRYKLDRN